MKKSETIFDYLGQILMVFGGTILVLNLFCVLFGAEEQMHSTMFALGNQGLSVSTVLQFLAMSAIITTLKFLLFSDVLMKKVSTVVRIICMFTLVMLCIVVFIVVFDWFPVNQWEAWLMFFLCFGLSVAVSTGLTALKEKTENRKMEEALKRLKEESNENSH